MKTGTLYIVSAPIGNPEDFTVRALRILKEVPLIAAENPQMTQALLEPHQIATPLTTYHNLNKEEKSRVLLSRLRDGQSVALVCDVGTPVIRDPGRFLIAQAIKAGITVTPVPGPSALLAALVATGWPGDRFTFAGAWPSRRTAQQRLLLEWAGSTHPIIFFVDARRLEPTLEQLLERVGNRLVVMGIDLTMPTERVLRGRLRHLLAQQRAEPLRGEVTLLIKGSRTRMRRQERKPAR